MSPSGVDKGELSAENILIIDEHARVLSDNGGKPSDESPLHIRVVKERGAGAVFHTHSIWNTILSDLHASDGGLELEGYEMRLRASDHTTRVAGVNSQDISALADGIGDSRTTPECASFLLRRHGLYSWGRISESKAPCRNT
jgi:methylthioribulose-1-phosphate dehydratase